MATFISATQRETEGSKKKKISVNKSGGYGADEML